MITGMRSACKADAIRIGLELTEGHLGSKDAPFESYSGNEGRVESPGELSVTPL